MATVITVKPCIACAEPMTGIEGALYDIHFACVRARHKAAMDHRCHCGRKKRPGDVKNVGGYTVLVDGEKVKRGGRSWIPCLRCLGTIEQLS